MREVPNLKIDINDDDISGFCRKWKITELAFFGSVLRDNFGPDSDIDILVVFAADAKYTIFDIIRAENELACLFGRKVDLVEKSSVIESENYIRRKDVLNSLKVAYVA